MVSQLLRSFTGATESVRLDEGSSILYPDFVPRTPYVYLDVQLELPWSETAHYEHSKLYYALDGDDDFSEDRAICVHLPSARDRRTLAIALPDDVRDAPHARLRFDPAPRAHSGRCQIFSIRATPPRRWNQRRRRSIERAADLERLKDFTRRAGQRAEDDAATVVGALPQTFSVELTARCNLTCTHCSSHGTEELHRRYNAMPEMTSEQLARLADEVFPSASTIGLVGRGEPLLVSGRLWQTLCDKLSEYGNRLTLVTNGLLANKRLVPGVVPLLETVHFSVDGATPEVMAENRGGASLDRVLDAIATLDRRRRDSHCARRPRIGISWTLKRNNFEQLPGFIAEVAPLGIDQLTVRHMLTFHAHSAGESLAGDAHVANDALRETYEMLERFGIRSDCPPLATGSSDAEPVTDARQSQASTTTSVPVSIGRRPAAQLHRQRDGCMFVHRTAVVHADGLVPTCSAPFAAGAGSLAESSFAEIWNGQVMREVRSTLDTPEEWQQCRHCWYREGRYQSQRRAFDGAAGRYSLDEADSISSEAWDFGSFTQD